MPTSANGWIVLDAATDGPPPRLREWILKGVGRKLLLRDGSAGFLLVHLAMWFHEEIEEIDTGSLDDWGWSPRRITGTDVWSNHASGTAVDLNSDRHPAGVETHKTYTPAQINKIHTRMTFYNDCIRWGGDYQTRPDAMHFEINRDESAVNRRARELCDSPRGRTITRTNRGSRALIYA